MTFDELLAADYKYPTVALFYGLQCAPCERLEPKLRAICKDMGVRLEEFNSASELPAIRELGLRTVPAVVVVHKGNVSLALSGDAGAVEIKARLAAAGVKTA